MKILAAFSRQTTIAIVKKNDNKNATQMPSLLDNIKKLLQDRGVESDKVDRFKEHMVVVKLDQHPISGSVTCALCEPNTSKFIVGTNVKGNNTYWNNSNYGKHLARVHGYEPPKQRVGKKKKGMIQFRNVIKMKLLMNAIHMTISLEKQKSRTKA